MDKRTVFWLVFFGSAGVVAAIPEVMTGSDPGVAPVSRPAPPAKARSAPSADGVAAAPAPLPATDGNTAVPSAGDASLFQARSWYVTPPPPPEPPPAPPAAPTEPPPPTAPPLPFKVMGKFDDASSLKVFLQRDEKVYTLAVGDVIDDTYRVASISGSQITLIYLPLNIPQTLSLGTPL